MNLRRLILRGGVALLVVLVLLVMAQIVAAQTGDSPAQDASSPVVPQMESLHYKLNWDVVANGGGAMSSTSYSLHSTLGQPAIGTATSTHYQLHAGFWQLFYNYVFLPFVVR